MQVVEDFFGAIGAVQNSLDNFDDVIEKLPGSNTIINPLKGKYTTKVTVMLQNQKNVLHQLLKQTEIVKKLLPETRKVLQISKNSFIYTTIK